MTSAGNGLATLHVVDTLRLRAVGVDVDRTQIELARRVRSRTGALFVTASATQLPFAAAAFDIVSTNKTMHHVPEWGLALDEIKRVVAPGGYVVFADLNVPLGVAPGGLLGHARAGSDHRSRAREPRRRARGEGRAASRWRRGERHAPSRAGAQAVVAQAAAFSKLGLSSQVVLVNGNVGVVSRLPDGRVLSVIGFTIAGGKVVEMDILADPDRLGRLDLSAIER